MKLNIGSALSINSWENPVVEQELYLEAEVGSIGGFEYNDKMYEFVTYKDKLHIFEENGDEVLEDFPDDLDEVNTWYFLYEVDNRYFIQETNGNFWYELSNEPYWED